MKVMPRKWGLLLHSQDLLHMGIIHTLGLHHQDIQVIILLLLLSIKDLSQSVWMRVPQVVSLLTLLQARLIVQRYSRQVAALQDLVDILDLIQVTQIRLTRHTHLHIPLNVTHINRMTTLQHLHHFITPHLTWEIINFARVGVQSTQSQ